MKLVESLAALRYDQPLVLVIGSFDGVHRGHIYLLTQARERAREHHLAFGIITFDPAPALVLRPGLGDYQITGRDLKMALLAALEPDLLAVVPFTRELAALTAKQFIDTLEDGLQLAELWVGDDFRFGRDREGGIPYLLERARNAEFAVHVVARQGPQAGVPDVSSSAIRDAIHAGDVRL
jgi:riboflavin kinase/FMN adenylyltransferase